MNALSCRVAVVVFVVVEEEKVGTGNEGIDSTGLSRGGSIRGGGHWRESLAACFFEPVSFLLARMLTSSAGVVSAVA